MTLIKSFAMPTETYSASVSPDLSTFVTGGEDFKIYKCSYEDGSMLGNSFHVHAALHVHSVQSQVG